MDDMSNIDMRNKNSNKTNLNFFQASNKVFLLTLFMSLFILILLVLLIFLPQNLYLSDNHSKTNQLSLASDTLFNVDSNRARNMNVFADKYILELRNENLNFLTFQGEVESSYAINSDNAKLDFNDNYALVSDLNGFNYYLFSQKGLVYEGRSTEKVIYSTVSNEGYVALILDTFDSKGMVRLLDPKGKHLMDYKLRERIRSGYPISLCFNLDSSKLFINIINLDGAHIQTHIHTIDLENLNISTHLNLVNSLALPKIYSPDKNLVALSNNTNFILSNLNTVSSKTSFNEIKDLSLTREEVYFLAKVEMEDEFSVYSIKYSELLGNDDDIDNQPEITGPLQVGENPYLIHSGSDYTAVATDNGIYIISNNNVFFYEMGNIEILKMSFISKKQLLLICKDGVRLVNI